MNTLKAIITTIFFLSINSYSIGQIEVYRVKQTQMTNDFKEYVSIDKNLIFDEVIIKQDEIEIGLPGNKVGVFKKGEIIKEYGEGASYSYKIPITKDMEITLFFTPYPKSTDTPRLFMAFVTMAGLVKSNPDIVNFFRLVFVDDLVI